LIKLANKERDKLGNEAPGSQYKVLNNEDPHPLREVDDYAEEQDNRGGDAEQVTDWGRLRGIGPPRVSEFMGTVKAFADGGGLCSPGRWAPEARKTEDYGLNDVRDSIFPLFQKAVVDERGRETTPMDFILRVSAGRFDASPFNEVLLDQARLVVAGLLGGGEDVLKVEPGQRFRFDLIAQLLKRAADPDWAFFDQLKKGLSLGVDMVMDRTPRVFEEKDPVETPRG